MSDFDIIRPKPTEFGEIMQNNGNYAVQGHSRSPLSVALIRMQLCVNNNLGLRLHPTLYRFQDVRIIGQIFGVDKVAFL